MLRGLLLVDRNGQKLFSLSSLFLYSGRSRSIYMFTLSAPLVCVCTYTHIQSVLSNKIFKKGLIKLNTSIQSSILNSRDGRQSLCSFTYVKVLNLHETPPKPIYLSQSEMFRTEHRLPNTISLKL